MDRPATTGNAILSMQIRPFLRGALVAITAALIVVAGADTPASGATTGRVYERVDFSPDGTRLLVHVIDRTRTSGSLTGIVEIALDAAPRAEAIHYPCGYSIEAAHYLPDDGGVALALNPGAAGGATSPRLVGMVQQTGAILFETAVPGTSFIRGIELSEDGRSIFLAHDLASDETIISRYDIADGRFGPVFDGFSDASIDFTRFAGAANDDVLFVAAKNFRRLTDEDIAVLGPPSVMMADLSTLLFETTSDPHRAVLSRFYPLLRETTEEATGAGSIWGSYIYHVGGAIRREFGADYAALGAPDSGHAERRPLVHRFSDGQFVPLFNPGMEFEEFAVSPDGNRIAIIDRTLRTTIVLFERLDGGWVSRPLNPILDRVTRLDSCAP